MINQLEKGSKVGIVCCSNGQKASYRDKLEILNNVLTEIGLVPIFSDYIFEQNGAAAGSAEERAAALMDFYRDEEIKAIFDISGGDMANEILQELDYNMIGNSGKQFWGYSDLTTIINGIYAKTGKSSVLYQVRNLLYDYGERQKADFKETVLEGKGNLTEFPYEFVQGDFMEGIVLGGNIRCLLKLAGTPYFPDLNGKILLLEAYSGLVPRMRAYLSQLKQMGAFERAFGILLGTFTQLEQEGQDAKIEDLVLSFAGKGIPIAKTGFIGHGPDSRAIEIGAQIRLEGQECTLDRIL